MIAYVVDYTGSAAHYRISSSVHAKSVAPLRPLDIGDRIIVLPARRGGKPVINVAVDGRVYSVDAAHSPLCIVKSYGDCKVVATARSSANPVVTAWRNILSSVASLLRMAKDDADSGRRATSVGRSAGHGGGPPVLHLIGGVEPARIDGVGFAIAWSGGHAPFKVSITSRNGTPAATATTARSALVLKSLRLPAGEYTVKVVDAADQLDDGEIVVGRAGSIPAGQCPEQVARELCPVVEAAQLAKRGKLWYLAAYQKLAFASHLDSAGQALMEWLTKG